MPAPKDILRDVVPILSWGRKYTREGFRNDFIAGVIVLFITVPQVIAYAFLAGMPPETGLYAAMLALTCYAAFGSSRTLAVGPTAIIGMMTLEVAAGYADPYSAEYVSVVVKLALVTGGVLIVLRILNFGAVISFLSHAVVTGFITAAAILIMTNQVPSMLGLPPSERTSMEAVVLHIFSSLSLTNMVVVGIASGAVALLVFCRGWLQGILERRGIGEAWVGPLVRSAPMYAVVLGILIVWIGGLSETAEVGVVGQIPTSLPHLSLVTISFAEVQDLLPSALLIAMVIFLESTSVGAAVASKRREKIEPNQELVGLGVANIGSSIAGGFPVAGSFARTVVNHSSGATSPVASLVTAAFVMVTVVAFAPLFYYLPKAVLSAIIVLSASQLIDVNGIRKIFSFNAIDAITFTFTFLAVLAFGVETGILVGILISFVLLIRASSRPHIAVVGRVGNSEHFRNVERYDVSTSAEVMAVRIDESLYFVNTRYIETFLLNRVADSKELKHLLLICNATNFIDSSGLEMLELLNENLYEAGVTLHLSEVKGPVMDRLKETEFYEKMHGEVFFTTDIAMRTLSER